MKTIELVFLIGSQCVSPVQDAPGFTEVAKVQCAVVIEKDTETNVVTVTPPGAASIPRVAEAMRMPPLAVPASASGLPEAAAPERGAGVVRMEVSPTAEEPSPVAEQRQALAAEPEPEPAREKPAKSVRSAAKAKKKTSLSGEPRNLCGAGRKAVWYTASPGHRKYRCRSATASSATPKKKSASKKVRKSLY